MKKVERVRLLQMNENATVVEVTARIKNPNRLKFKVSSDDLKLYINKNESGKIRFRDKLKIKSNCEESYTFVLEAKPDKAMGIMSLLGALGSRKLNIGIKGGLKASSWGLSKTYPIDINQNINPGEIGF